MNKETVGLVASLGLLFVGYFWVNSFYATKNAPLQSTITPVAAPSAPAAAQAPAPTIAPELAPTPVAESIPLVPDDALVVRSPVLEVAFRQLGGCVAQARLLKYREKLGSPEPAELFSNYQLCKAFAFRIGNTDLRDVLARVTRESENGISLSQTVNGLELVRSFQFSPEDYRGQMSVQLRNLTNAEQQTSVQFDLGASSERKDAGGMFAANPLEGRSVAYLANDEVERHALHFEGSPEPKVIVSAQGIKPLWVSSGSMYFLNIVMPKGGEAMSFYTRQTGAVIAKDAKSPSDQTVFESWLEQGVKLAPGESKSFEYDLYLGPKLKRELDKFEGKQLDKAVDFGFFSVIAWPLFYALDFIHGLVRNWGVAIIILTAFVKILLYPLARKSYVSMKKMQKIQPELKALQEKYKDDKQKLNQETMALMSQKGANPLSGCLPLLPQLPIFFGLYSMFQQTFELRQAPFFFWIRDLSVMDPYFVLPILIAILYYVQQKLTPIAPGMDPVQQKMMQVLPFVFSLMMITFPSGLALYIVTNTILSIAQQWYMMRKYKDV